jgi:hypothetical protein
MPQIQVQLQQRLSPCLSYASVYHLVYLITEAINSFSNPKEQSYALHNATFCHPTNPTLDLPMQDF